MRGGKNGPRRALVTGGGGFLGGAIVRLLIERGDDVSSYCRKFYPELESMGVTQMQGDVGDKEGVSKACEGIDLVFHVAGKPGVWGKYADYYSTNVTGTQNIIEACRKQAVSLLVHTSSPSVVFDGSNMVGVNESVPYPDKHLTHYQKTKAEAERCVVDAAAAGLKTIILRPHLIWGPGDNHLVPRIIARAKTLMRVGNGSNLVDATYIDNAAHAHVLAAETLAATDRVSGKIYFISQGEPMPLWDMIDSILAAADLPPVRRSIPKRAAWSLGALLELVYGALRIKNEPKMTRFVAEELATSHWFDLSAARSDLGYTPKVSTQEGLRRLKAWLQSLDSSSPGGAPDTH